MGMGNVNGGPLPQDPSLNAGSVPQTSQKIQEAFGNGVEFLKALTAPGVGKVGQTANSFAVAENNKNINAQGMKENQFASPASANDEIVAAVMTDPVAMAQMGQNIATGLQALSVLSKQITAPGDKGFSSIDSINSAATNQMQSAPPEDKAQASIMQRTEDAAVKFRGGMFDEGAIALQAIMAEVASMKKGQAYLMAQISQQAMAAMIDGSHTQAQIIKDKAQAESFASFMNAGLQLAGAAITIGGTASALKKANTGALSKEQEAQVELAGDKAGQAHLADMAKDTKFKNTPDRIKDDMRLKAEDDAKSDMKRQLEDVNKASNVQLLTARTTMTSALANIFSNVSTSFVDGIKAQQVGQLEAQKVVLENALQILGQMMSKWGDSEREMHDDVTKAYDAMKQMHEAMVTNINKLAV